MSKEYTYDIDKYTIGVDENGEDGIGMTVAKIENGEIEFLGNCYGENARCIDLLIKENKQLNGAIQIYDILLKSNVEGNRKQQEMIDKIFSRITLWKMEDITKETAKILDELLDILKEVSE